MLPLKPEKTVYKVRTALPIQYAALLHIDDVSSRLALHPVTWWWECTTLSVGHHLKHNIQLFQFPKPPPKPLILHEAPNT